MRKYFPEIAQKIIPDTQRYEKIRQQNIYAVNTLKKLHVEVNSPKLVYAHLYASHWPYLLSPDGAPGCHTQKQKLTKDIFAGVQYLNNTMLDVIDSILQKRENTAGDHSSK